MWDIFWITTIESSHMCYNALLDDKFYEFLVRIDQDLAAQTQAGRCRHCGSALHKNRYQRKPKRKQAIHCCCKPRATPSSGVSRPICTRRSCSSTIVELIGSGLVLSA